MEKIIQHIKTTPDRLGNRRHGYLVYTLLPEEIETRWHAILDTIPFLDSPIEWLPSLNVPETEYNRLIKAYQK